MAQKITQLTPRGGAPIAPRAESAPLPGDASLDATLPPTPLKKLLAADGAAVYVLSEDATLVETVTTAAGEHFPIQLVPTFKALRSLVDTGQCKIALLDAESFGSALRARIAELKSTAPTLVTLVAAPRETAEELMGLFSERIIHRLLIKPAAAGITRLLLESAVSRYLQARESPDVNVEDPLVSPQRRRAAPGSSRSAWFLATALVTVLVAGVLIAGLVRFGAEDATLPAAVPSTAAGATPEENPPESATEGSEDNADALNVSAAVTGTAESDGGAAEVAAPDAEAVDAETAALVTGTAALTAALSDGAAEPAAAAEQSASLEAEPGSRPGADAAAVLTSVPAAAETALATPPISTPSVQVARPPTELESLLAIARARFERNQLLDPAGDSTRDYVERALALDAENQDALAVRAELAAAVTDSARLVLESGDLEGATALANEARRLGAPSETLALLDLDLAAAREAAARRAQGQLLALGLERMRQDRLVAPEDDSALFYLGRLNDENADYPGFASAWGELSVLLTDRIETAISTQDWEGAESWIAALASVADGTAVEAQRRELAAARLQAEYLAKPAAAGELRIATTGQLEYPADALRLEIDGWVYVEFIVGVDGVPRDARILDASPRNRFEEAALSAVSLYRYVPFERDGRVYERLARLRIRFDLQ